MAKKKRLTDKQFDRIVKLWTVLTPLIVSVVTLASAIAVALISHSSRNRYELIDTERAANQVIPDLVHRDFYPEDEVKAARLEMELESVYARHGLDSLLGSLRVLSESLPPSTRDAVEMALNRLDARRFVRSAPSPRAPFLLAAALVAMVAILYFPVRMLLKSTVLRIAKSRYEVR